MVALIASRVCSHIMCKHCWVHLFYTCFRCFWLVTKSMCCLGNAASAPSVYSILKQTKAAQPETLNTLVEAVWSACCRLRWGARVWVLRAQSHRSGTSLLPKPVLLLAALPKMGFNGNGKCWNYWGSKGLVGDFISRETKTSPAKRDKGEKTFLCFS